jgi:hypothetical protein
MSACCETCLCEDCACLGCVATDCACRDGTADRRGAGDRPRRDPT